MSLTRAWIVVGTACWMALACGSDPALTVDGGDEEAGAGGTVGGSGGRQNSSGGTTPGVEVPGGGGVPSEDGGANDGGSVSSGPRCGNAELDDDEDCDDGNARPGDGCSGVCRVEPNYECPEVGEPCVSTLVCGDGALRPEESCDDGNADSDDGCSADCMVEPGFACSVAGEACVPVESEECGDGAVNAGENCDDGNIMDLDGCSADCMTVEPGYSCQIAGEPCELADFCGDGEVSLELSEECDDGDAEGGDGCSTQCVVETGYRCPDPGMPCESTVVCGDRLVRGDETCDDGDDPPASGDGCSSSCQLETGWVCPPGAVCRAAACGDGLIIGREQCDDANIADLDGCSSTCRLENGFKCDNSPEPSVCTPTVCGDGVREGLEPCDDGDNDWGDGCTPTCQVEPTCANGAACASECGDGIKFPSENCDDGTITGGDGCSATCTIEPGFECTTAGGTPELLTLPLVLRDFKRGAPLSQPADPGITAGHGDFQWGGEFGNGQDYEDSDGNLADNWTDAPDGETGDAWATVRDGNILAQNWDLGGLEYGFVADLLAPDKKPAFGYTGDATTPDDMGDCPLEWGELIRDGQGYCVEQVQNAESFGRWFHDDDAYNNTYLRALYLSQTTGSTYVYDSDITQADGTPYPDDATHQGFWPLEDVAGVTKYGQCGGGPNRNFYFSSEVHHWFQFDADAPPTLIFTGDDDVFVFIKGRLVLDLGGIHAREEGTVTIDANGDATVERPNVADLVIDDLDLADGSIYEIIVFQAERNTCESNYRLELENFNLQKSTCEPVCGDGVVTPDEACDDGDNDGSYGTCNADCSLAPYCGDGILQPDDEECDLGINVDTYSLTADACAPGCVRPPFCGDGAIQSLYEACDLGADNDDAAYGSTGCTEACLPAPYCGDRRVDVDNGEVCDDGDDNGSGEPGSCLIDCSGRVPQPDCGDGSVDPGEICDDGDENGSAASSCDMSCRLKCGNGFVEAGEECDDGVNDGSYGTCTEDCGLAGYCGDGDVNGPEQCDLGDDNEEDPYGEDTCTLACGDGPYCGDDRVQTRFGEECDGGANCTSSCDLDEVPE